ncbi:MAG: hypothetical protein ACJ74Y_10315, partial [Bryobacteraceae bacterium]
MDRNLNGRGQTAYRIAQCCCILIVAVRGSLATRPGITATLVLSVLLLCSLVRKIGGSIAGSISLALISCYPRLIDLSPAQALGLLSLVTLVWLLATRDWARDGTQVVFCLALAGVTAFGSLNSVSFF